MTLKKEWILNGKTYQRAFKTEADQPLVAVDGAITLSATRACIDSMADHTGKPIDANLAVRFIRKFNDKFDLIPKDTDELNALIDEGDNDKIMGSHQASVKLINSTVPLLHGMTFDRDLILKILSQPKCEGIRLYLCAKPDGQSTEDYEMSLVVVGVDGLGGDLYFYKGSDAAAIAPEHTEVEMFAEPEGDTDICNESLTGEYSTPPPDSGGQNTTEEFFSKPKIPYIDPRYVLLSLASKLP